MGIDVNLPAVSFRPLLLVALLHQRSDFELAFFHSERRIRREPLQKKRSTRVRQHHHLSLRPAAPFSLVQLSCFQTHKNGWASYSARLWLSFPSAQPCLSFHISFNSMRGRHYIQTRAVTSSRDDWISLIVLCVLYRLVSKMTVSQRSNTSCVLIF